MDKSPPSDASFDGSCRISIDLARLIGPSPHLSFWTPEICTANRRHRRLRSRHDDAALNTALTQARNLIRDWLDADDQPRLQQRWTQRLNGLRHDPAADPYRPSHYRIELATYSETVLLAGLLASPRWRAFPMPHIEAQCLLAQQ